MNRNRKVITLDEFFEGYPDSRHLFDALLQRINAIDAAEPVVTKSQIAFRRTKQFAWVWIPEKHLRRRAAPLVISLSLPFREPSSRWKEIVEPVRGRFIHHLELYSLVDIDDQVAEWLRLAWQLAE